VAGLTISLSDEQLAAFADALAPLVAKRLDRVQSEPWPEWMSVETAARYLDCSPERLRKLCQRDQIPYYQDGGKGHRVFFDREQLDAWMQSHRHTRGRGAGSATVDAERKMPRRGSNRPGPDTGG
jgi:excisionase family DNA binding protein